MITYFTNVLLDFLKDFDHYLVLFYFLLITKKILTFYFKKYLVHDYFIFFILQYQDLKTQFVISCDFPRLTCFLAVFLITCSPSLSPFSEFIIPLIS